MLRASGFSEASLVGDYNTNNLSTKINRRDSTNEMCEITKLDKNSVYI